MVYMKRLVAGMIGLLFSTFSFSDVTLQDFNGENISFSSMKGEWVLLHYWAQWCSVCLGEIPELNRFYEQNKDKHIRLFAVNYDPLSLEDQKIIAKDADIRFPSIANNPARELRLGHIRGVPATFVFNPQGELSETLYGPQTMIGLQESVNIPNS